MLREGKGEDLQQHHVPPEGDEELPLALLLGRPVDGPRHALAEAADKLAGHLAAHAAHAHGHEEMVHGRDDGGYRVLLAVQTGDEGGRQVAGPTHRGQASDKLRHSHLLVHGEGGALLGSHVQHGHGAQARRRGRGM